MSRRLDLAAFENPSVVDVGSASRQNQFLVGPTSGRTRATLCTNAGVSALVAGFEWTVTTCRGRTERAENGWAALGKSENARGHHLSVAEEVFAERMGGAKPHAWRAGSNAEAVPHHAGGQEIPD